MPRNPTAKVTPTNASKLAADAVTRKKKLLVAIQGYLKHAIGNENLKGGGKVTEQVATENLLNHIS